MARVLVFDSGFGGLSVAAALRLSAPNITVDYAADFAFFPYGEKSDTELAARLPDLLNGFANFTRADMIIIACNTATTLSLEAVRARVSCPVVGTVPAIKPAAKLTQTGVIGLLATPATIKRDYTDQLIADFAPNIDVIKVGSAALVNIAEAVLQGEEVESDMFWTEQQPFFHRSSPADTIVLGCTHFPHIVDQLEAASAAHGLSINYVDPSLAIAKHAISLIPQTPHADNTPQTAVLTLAPTKAQMKVFSRFGFSQIRVLARP